MREQEQEQQQLRLCVARSAGLGESEQLTDHVMLAHCVVDLNLLYAKLSSVGPGGSAHEHAVPLEGAPGATLLLRLEEVRGGRLLDRQATGTARAAMRTVQLGVRCRNLVKADLLSKSDPCLAMYLQGVFPLHRIPGLFNGELPTIHC